MHRSFLYLQKKVFLLAFLGAVYRVFKRHPHPVILLRKKLLFALRLVLSGKYKLLWSNLRQITYSATRKPPSIASIVDPCIDILATRHTQYVAHLLEKAFTEASLDSRILYEYIATEDSGQLYIVICPQMFPELPINFISFQMEQSINPRWFTENYFATLNNALAIFDYSLINIEYLINHGIPYGKLFYLPIGAYADYPAWIGNNKAPPSKSIDVLFYGDPNCNRRLTFLKRLKEKFEVYIASEIYGDELLELIKCAKVIVNIHYYENALLETTRLYETLSLGVPIVSEQSMDMECHQDIKNVVSFTPAGDIDSMIEEIERIISNETYYAQRVSSIKEFVQQDQKFSNYFKRFLLANDLLSFDEYQASVNFIPLTYNNIPRLCLSLSETVERNQGFLSHPRHGFDVIEGIRHHKGWLGCGMSYKYMLTRLMMDNVKLAILCEDDVIFPTNFDYLINKITTYLIQTSYQWHVFSGLIAHLHPDTEILAIEEHEGIEYIYINKMTSTVMNIYSFAAMEIISTWDEKNQDANTNTIDRYLEAQRNLVVITTLPFLVGHSEDVNSTLWGFPNIEYSSLISNSSKLLLEKVRHYKARNRMNH